MSPFSHGLPEAVTDACEAGQIRLMYTLLPRNMSFFPLMLHLRSCEAHKPSVDVSKGSTDFPAGFMVCLNSQQFTAGQNIEVPVSIQLCKHARAPTHTKTQTYTTNLTCDKCNVNTYFSLMCVEGINKKSAFCSAITVQFNFSGLLNKHFELQRHFT